MLQQGVGDDDIANPGNGTQAAGSAGEDCPLSAELVDKQGRRHRRGNLADARQHCDDLLAVKMTEPKLASGENHRLFVGHCREQRA